MRRLPQYQPESKAVGVICDGNLEWHMYGLGASDYVTACGLDGHDPDIGQEMGPLPEPGQKITCQQCWALYKAFRESGVTAKDFAPEAKR